MSVSRSKGVVAVDGDTQGVPTMPYQAPWCPEITLECEGQERHLRFPAYLSLSAISAKTETELDADAVRLSFTLTHKNAALWTLKASVRCRRACRLLAVTKLDLVHDLAMVWRTPATAWGSPQVYAQPTEGPVGYDIGAVFDPQRQRAICVGHLWPARTINVVEATPNRLRVVARPGVDLGPGEVWESDTLVVHVTPTVAEGLQRLGDMQTCRRPTREVAAHAGWNSWDTYHSMISPEVLRENLEVIRSHPVLRRRIRYFILDDGWQNCCGDWLPNEKFPDGLAAMAEEIRAAGLVPGIWSAPFMVNRHSQLLQDHPDWVVRYKDVAYSPWEIKGSAPPWGDRCYLDPTHPGVRNFVSELYERLHGWGFRYFKTDFLCDPISPLIISGEEKHRPYLRYHSLRESPLVAHRDCMARIRRAIGEESFWLGCGSYFATGAGLFDASRISADISPVYGALTNCATSITHNFHLHGAAFWSDPDFAVFRGPATTLDGRKGFSLDEARLWGSLLIMSGGMITLSDPLAELNEAGLAIIAKVLEHAGGPAAVPLAPESQQPTALVKYTGRDGYLCLVNWGEAPAMLPIPELDAQMARDVWTGESVVLIPGQTLPTPPHGCRLLRWESGASGLWR